MKILFVDQIARVNYKYSFSLINKLKENHEVLFISDEKCYKDDTLKVYNLFNGITDKAIGKVTKALNYIKAWKRIYEICKLEKVDAVHVQWFILSPIDCIYLNKIKKLGVSIVVTVHDILPFNEKFYDYKSHKKIYDLASQIIVQAKPNIDRINSTFHGIASKVVYIPHGNFVEHVDIIEKDKARELLNISKEKKVILFFGQIKSVKGLDVLIRAYGELVKKENDEKLLLLIAGKVWEDDFEKYQNIIDEMNISNNVRCDIKYIPDEEIGWYYCASDINVLPYREVYQSGVVHLAYAYKKPVIATNVGSFPEVILDGESGMLIKKDDVLELTKVMKELIYDENRMVNMGILGREFIEENFSWDKIAKQISEIYSSLNRG